MPDSDRPFIDKRKLNKVGGSMMIAIPPEWIEKSGYKEGDDVFFMMNADIKFLCPGSTSKIYDKLSKEVAKKV